MVKFCSQLIRKSDWLFSVLYCGASCQAKQRRINKNKQNDIADGSKQLLYLIQLSLFIWRKILKWHFYSTASLVVKFQRKPALHFVTFHNLITWKLYCTNMFWTNEIFIFNIDYKVFSFLRDVCGKIFFPFRIKWVLYDFRFEYRRIEI